MKFTPNSAAGNTATEEVSFPFTYAKRSVTCKIYKTPKGEYDSFTLVYYKDGARVRQVFSSFEDALKEADEVTRLLGTKNLDVLELRSADRASYLRARELLDPLGVSLEVAIAQYVHAKSLLGATPIAVAVEDYVRRHPVRIPDVKVPVVVTEFLQAKEADGCSDRYLQCLRYNLGLFQKRFPGFIQAVVGNEIDSWLRGSGLSPRTRNNVRTSIYTLYKFAAGRRYLPKGGHDELDAVSVVKDGDGDIEVFTVAEFKEVLSCASKAMVPFLALGAFAGIRHAEIQRLEWKDIRLDYNTIEVGASKAKTASRRLVPLLPNLKEWLHDLRAASGPVVELSNVAFELHRITKRINQSRRAAWATANGVSEEQLKEAEAEAKALAARAPKRKLRTQKGEVPPGAETARLEGWEPFAWKHNGLRHSFISYRLAAVQNTAQVALEAGNSPQTIFKHYRELVQSKDAEAWFGLAPASV
jgi:integrase